MDRIMWLLYLWDVSSYVYADYVEVLGIHCIDTIGNITEKMQIKANSHVFIVHMRGFFMFLNWSH